MSHCHGSPWSFLQADCGDVGPHNEHDYTDTDRVCLGSPEPFIEADCGRAGPHDKHPFSEIPENTR